MLDLIEKPSVLIVLLLVIVVFGAKRLPDSARALGKSMRILKAEAKGLKDDDTPTATPAAASPAAPVLPAPALPVSPTVALPVERPVEQSQQPHP